MRTNSASHAYGAVVLTDGGREWLDDSGSTLFGRARDSQPTTSAKDTTVASDDEALYERLVGVRNRLAQRLPPYMVCSNDTIRQLAKRRPGNDAELLGVSGFGKVKVQKYGAAFLECIAKYGTGERSGS